MLYSLVTEKALLNKLPTTIEVVQKEMTVQWVKVETVRWMVENMKV
jgi:hypothetical protein